MQGTGIVGKSPRSKFLGRWVRKNQQDRRSIERKKKKNGEEEKRKNICLKEASGSQMSSRGRGKEENESPEGLRTTIMEKATGA